MRHIKYAMLFLGYTLLMVASSAMVGYLVSQIVERFA